MQAKSKPTLTGKWQGVTLAFTVLLLISLLSLDNLQVINLNHSNISMIKYIVQKGRQRAYAG